MRQQIVDLERALLDPAAVFSSPKEVARHQGLTPEQKRQILDRWRYGAIELAVATDEGMRGPDNASLPRILTAIDEVDVMAARQRTSRGWNVVVTTHEQGYRTALRVLKVLGGVARSPYHNVLLMVVEDPLALLAALEERAAHEPMLLDTISRVAPAIDCFNFSSAADFEIKVKNAAVLWLPRLASASFHVRLHHRGSRWPIATPAMERSIGEDLLDRVVAAGAPGRIAFDDPDAVIAIDTVDNRAGIGFWTRNDLSRYRFLRPD